MNGGGHQLSENMWSDGFAEWSCDDLQSCTVDPDFSFPRTKVFQEVLADLKSDENSSQTETDICGSQPEMNEVNYHHNLGDHGLIMIMFPLFYFQDCEKEGWW